MTAIARIHRETILERVKGGEILREIAKDLGVSKQSLHAVLKDDPEYAEARKIQAASMIEEAKQTVWDAREPHDIARAREISRFAFRYAESVDSANWAPRSHVTMEQVGDLGERLRRSRERTIEAETVVDAQQTQRSMADLPQIGQEGESK